MTGKHTFVKLGEILEAAKEGRLSKVKSAAENEQQLFMFGENALRLAALNGHVEVVQFLHDRHFVSFIGKYGTTYRDVMANAPDEVKDWFQDETTTYIRMDKEWREMIEDGIVDAEFLLTPPDPEDGTQHPLLTAACADAFSAAVDILVKEGRAHELTAEHFQIADYDSTLIGYLIAFDQLQDAFRPDIWAGRLPELEKFWRQIPPAVQPEIDLNDIFEDARHHAILKKIRATKWPRLKGTGRDKKPVRRRSGAR